MEAGHRCIQVLGLVPQRWVRGRSGVRIDRWREMRDKGVALSACLTDIEGIVAGRGIVWSATMGNGGKTLTWRAR
jgi:hypothetical protein